MIMKNEFNNYICIFPHYDIDGNIMFDESSQNTDRFRVYKIRICPGYNFPLINPEDKFVVSDKKYNNRSFFVSCIFEAMDEYISRDEVIDNINKTQFTQ